ncbi:hypothetical protein LOC68_07610 [Blastopirellula sp. JC732]|uniref:Uncharacterized protein n=1 Tax=Blastopirellula sediminis TaxID=2894196 RepID=A0A9X1SFW5_9BACT|nr:hypothetical protein [Blastopirellula sediminis]MCC9608966.1 hypothetical protein [Blastopirellula sediminis]MCC9628257.1 hypothetical protein [Blastopirellula sediminis]
MKFRILYRDTYGKLRERQVDAADESEIRASFDQGNAELISVSELDSAPRETSGSQHAESTDSKSTRSAALRNSFVEDFAMNYATWLGWVFGVFAVLSAINVFFNPEIGPVAQLIASIMMLFGCVISANLRAILLEIRSRS